MDTTNKLEVERFLSRILAMKKDLSMQPHHVIPFIKKFYEYMVERDKIPIPIKMQDKIFITLNFLEQRIDKIIKRIPSSSSTLESIKLHFYSVSREYDFKIIRKYPGPLKDKEKLEVLESIKNILENLLTSEALDKDFRGDWATKFCYGICEIPQILVVSWVTSSKCIDEIN